jgi:hypothetical protein
MLEWLHSSCYCLTSPSNPFKKEKVPAIFLPTGRLRRTSVKMRRGSAHSAQQKKNSPPCAMRGIVHSQRSGQCKPERFSYRSIAQIRQVSAQGRPNEFFIARVGEQEQNDNRHQT